METIQIVIDSELKQAADALAKRQKVNRSALFREAMQELLKKRRIEEMEERERKAYEKFPETKEERLGWGVWEREAVWPKE